MASGGRALIVCGRAKSTFWRAKEYPNLVLAHVFGKSYCDRNADFLKSPRQALSLRLGNQGPQAKLGIVTIGDGTHTMDEKGNPTVRPHKESSFYLIATDRPVGRLN